MINELVEAQQYLNGEKINKRCMYRICWILTKYFKETGLDQYEIRERLFDWGAEHRVYFDFDINKPIFHAYSDKKKLRKDISIHISNLDVQEIIRRFDSKNVRMIALGLLCYAKAEADESGEFDISLSSFGNWIGIAGQNISKRYMFELTEMRYVKKEHLVKVNSWDKSVATKSTHMKMLVPCKNIGDYILQDNDIRKAYEDLLENKSRIIW